MRATARIVVLVILSLQVYNHSTAQKSNFTTNSGMTIGFGLGGAYQKSDLLNSRGGGIDFTLGSHLYKKDNAFFSIDWKFRFLAGENRAYDHRINSDNTYSNIHYRFFSYDLELGLTLNRLRERTRIIMTGFAGAGITHGLTSADLDDEGGNLYDFSSIDPNRDRKLVYDDLVALSDGNFETKLINRAVVLPTAGFFIGYQFSRSFSMGIEYKTNFYLTEHNSFSGSDLDNRVIKGSAIDRNNYVGLGLKWNLRGGSSSSYSFSERMVETLPAPGTTETTTTANRITTPPPVYLPQPVVHIFDPSADPYQTASNTYIIKATIRNVSGSGDISFYQNEQPNRDFSYNMTMKTFEAEVQLREGENAFRILAENQTSTAEDLVSITLDYSEKAVEPVVVVAPASPPEVDIISHVNNSVRTYEPSARLRAIVLNVNSKEEITLTINGDNTRDFSFNPSTNVLSTDFALRDGSNILNISARNESGFDAKDQEIIKEARPCPPPLVKFIAPAQEQSSSNLENYEVWAEVINISSRSQLQLVVNGNSVSFNFNNNLVSSSVPLVSGINTLSLHARNECGEERVAARITYSPSVSVLPPCNPPKVSFSVNEVNRDVASHELRGSVSNVMDMADISLLIDGRANDGFRFDPTNGDLEADLKLMPGMHTVIVSVENDCGTDNMGVNVNMKEPCIQPRLSFTLNDVNRDDVSHELRGSVSGIKNRSGISLTLDGKAVDGFRFDPASGDLNGSFQLTPGTHTVAVSVNNPCGSDNQAMTVIMKEPCIPPRVSFTVNEVNRNDASHELRGSVSNVKNRADISISLNGNADDGFRFDPGTGEVNASFQLIPGTHTVVVSVNNACGSDNQVMTVVMEEVCIPPKVSISINEVTRNDASHELRGSVSNVKGRAGISLTVDGKADDEFRIDPETGEVDASFQLKPGTHTVVVSVNNACGSDNQVLTVVMEEVCIPPKVSISINEVNRDDASHELRGSVSNVKERAGISLTIDGRADDGFRFDPASGDMGAAFQLSPGPHTITVSAGNACGVDDQSVNINIEEPCVPPRVSFTIAEVSRDDVSHELRGSASNVKERSGISLTINGSVNDDFRFDPATSDLNATFMLTPGSHIIVVSVANACGSDKQEVSVIVEESCIPPRVSFTVVEVSRDIASHELRGSASNVKERSGISLTINSSAYDDFRFDPATGDLNAGFTLTPGSHTIAVAVTNACGTDNQGISVTIEEPCHPPKVSFNVTEVNLDDASHELSGSVSNVEKRDGITITVNGSVYDGFRFDPATGDLKAGLNLSPGAHAVNISVTNACGSDEQDVSVILEEPCIPPRISFTLTEVIRDDASHELSGSVSNVEDRSGISLSINGIANDDFRFDPSSGDLNAVLMLNPGSHLIDVSVSNACGTDNQDVSVIVAEPCISPKVSFTITEAEGKDASHELSGSASNVENKADISLTVDGNIGNEFQFLPETGDLKAEFNLSPGTHMIVVSVTNACGSDNQGISVTREEPCTSPEVSFSITEVNREDASHELIGTVLQVNNEADISLTVDGSAYNDFQFVPETGELNAKFNLTPGSHIIAITATNDCGTDSESESIDIEESACGIRINPGNSTWQFCLVTPSETFTREDLTDESFSYSGPATSLYFLPIGGGGEAVVKGNSYTVRSGQYYLFTGSLNVSVTTTNPGSMGHWSVCIESDSEPVHGNGNNRPESPCAGNGNNGNKGKKPDR